MTRSTMVDNMSTGCLKKMGNLYRARDFLGPRGFTVAYKSFVRPVCEYGSVAIIGASWLRDLVDVNSLYCILVVKWVWWGCSVNCLTIGDENHCSIFVQLLPPPHQHISTPSGVWVVTPCYYLHWFNLHPWIYFEGASLVQLQTVGHLLL